MASVCLGPTTRGVFTSVCTTEGELDEIAVFQSTLDAEKTGDGDGTDDPTALPTSCYDCSDDEDVDGLESDASLSP